MFLGDAAFFWLIQWCIFLHFNIILIICNTHWQVCIICNYSWAVRIKCVNQTGGHKVTWNDALLSCLFSLMDQANCPVGFSSVSNHKILCTICKTAFCIYYSSWCMGSIYQEMGLSGKNKHFFFQVKHSQKLQLVPTYMHFSRTFWSFPMKLP